MHDHAVLRRRSRTHPPSSAAPPPRSASRAPSRPPGADTPASCGSTGCRRSPSSPTRGCARRFSALDTNSVRTLRQSHSSSSATSIGKPGRAALPHLRARDADEDLVVGADHDPGGGAGARGSRGRVPRAATSAPAQARRRPRWRLQEFAAGRAKEVSIDPREVRSAARFILRAGVHDRNPESTEMRSTLFVRRFACIYAISWIVRPLELLHRPGVQRVDPAQTQRFGRRRSSAAFLRQTR